MLAETCLGQELSYEDVVIPVSKGTRVVAPNDGVTPLKTLRSVHVCVAIVKAKTIHGPNKIDLGVVIPDINVVNIRSGEKTVFRPRDLALGIDNEFIPGQFYESPELGFYHYCESIDNGIATIYLVESFQHGQLIQMKVTMEAKYGKHYIPVKDERVLDRFKRRLDLLKAS